MRLVIEHETQYIYSAPASATVQLIRLTPRPDPHQRVMNWSITAPGTQTRQIDAYGNITHLLTLYRTHESIQIKVTGSVELAPLENGRVDSSDSIPVASFGLVTPLTTPDDALVNFTLQALPKGLRNTFDALLLATRITDAVEYLPGFTEVTSSAQDAFKLGRGVCQDHAHVFLACCRVLGVPARYVSGYVHPGTSDHAASHAWVDVWLVGQGTIASGWVSVDVTNRQLTSDRHCRLAVARDYEAAAPVRGVRTGGGQETMQVKVSFGNSYAEQ
jgi:transglutaminase-like putative cysteine protease